jgi:hypothetical protein
MALVTSQKTREELRAAAAAAGLAVTSVKPLPLRAFPANLTRLAMFARKK